MPRVCLPLICHYTLSLKERKVRSLVLKYYEDNNLMHSLHESGTEDEIENPNVSFSAGFKCYKVRGHRLDVQNYSGPRNN